jgi:hypothetical protein
VKQVRRLYFQVRRWRASWCNRKAFVDDEVVDPLQVQATAGVLSDARRMESYDVGLSQAARALPSTIAANSRSLLVTVPWGVVGVMR